MGCYVSRQVQVITEENIIQQAKSLVLDAPIEEKRSIKEIIRKVSSRVSISSLRPDLDELENKRQDVSNEEDIPLPEIHEPIPLVVTAQAAGEEEPKIPCWNKTACCGRSCQVSHARFCCEHDFARPVEHYCQLCRERFEEWREANQAFEEMVQQMEQQLRSSGKIQLSLQQQSQEDDQEELSWGEHPDDDDDPLRDDSQCSSHSRLNQSECVLPCGHAAPQGHASVLDPCLQCQSRNEFWNWDTDSSNALEETQTERYQVMHAPPTKTALDRLRQQHPEASTADVWNPDKRRIMFLSRSPMVSSLSLEDSVTDSMRSF